MKVEADNIGACLAAEDSDNIVYIEEIDAASVLVPPEDVHSGPAPTQRT